MRHRAGGQDESWHASPSMYRALRRWSPAIMLGGMAASGWLIVRAVLVFETDGGRQTFGIDIPVAVFVLSAWATVAVVLMRPPRDVLARPTRTADTGPLVVWALGDDQRIWNVVGVPVAGFLGSLFFLPALLPSGPDSAADDEATPMVIALVLTVVVVIIAAIWMMSRCFLHGVELTGSSLVAHGYFLTRRFPRGNVERAVEIKLDLVTAAVFMVMRIEADRTVRLELTDGSTRRLLASSGGGAGAGAEIVNAWIAAGR